VAHIKLLKDRPTKLTDNQSSDDHLNSAARGDSSRGLRLADRGAVLSTQSPAGP
jgi:hypothetical protein